MPTASCIVINSRSRELKTTLAIVKIARQTKDPFQLSPLVIRHSLEISADFETFRERYPDLPIVVITDGYRAVTSEGFVEWADGGSFGKHALIVGEMPIGKSLRTLSRRSSRAIVFPPGTPIKKVQTPSGSNWELAGLARAGLRLLADEQFYEAFLVTGQSDWVKAWGFVHPETDWSWSEHVQLDHQSDRWSDEGLAKDLLVKVGRRDSEGKQAFIDRTKQETSPVGEILGEERFQEVLEQLVPELSQEEAALSDDERW